MTAKLIFCGVKVTPLPSACTLDACCIGPVARDTPCHVFAAACAVFSLPPAAAPIVWRGCARLPVPGVTRAWRPLTRHAHSSQVRFDQHPEVPLMPQDSWSPAPPSMGIRNVTHHLRNHSTLFCVSCQYPPHGGRRRTSHGAPLRRTATPRASAQGLMGRYSRLTSLIQQTAAKIRVFYDALPALCFEYSHL